MSDLDKLLQIVSIADLGVSEYYLDESGYNHIRLGHRDLGGFLLTGIKETVSNPTHIYKSSYDISRYQFVSYDVQSKRGHPMSVVVQLEGELGRIITASPKNKVNGQIVWDQKTGLYASYDDRSDVLYVSCGDARDAYAGDEDENGRIWFRFHEDDDSPAGITVFQAAAIWAQNGDALTSRVAGFLSIPQADVRRRMQELLGRTGV